MVRQRDDLCITIPTFFKCPISLDLMKSPVSLCTGVTYDRSSIQRWLDEGNNTCPATMQLLHTNDFIPNRTLHNLIQIWSESVPNRDNPPVSPSVLTRNQLIANLASQTNNNKFRSLTEVVRFAQDSDQNRTFLAKLDGFVPLLIGFLDNVNHGIQFLEQVLISLELVLDKIEDREKLKNNMLKGEKQLDSLLLVLQRGSTESKIATARVLKFIALDAESQLLIAEKEGLVTELLNSVTPEKDPVVIENCLACLVEISKPKRNKLKLVNHGAMKRLSKLLRECNNVAVVEKVLKLVETASSTREGRKEICEDSDCVAAILNKAMKVSSVATEHAVTTLWSVCYLFRDQKAQEAVTEGNGLTKILLLMQGSNCSPRVRQMCTDLLKIFRVNSKSCLSSYDTKTTHIMPF